MQITLKRLSLGLVSAGMLTIYGCGGGGGTPSATMTVTPSLGKFSAGTVVNINKALDGKLLSTGTITSNGSVILSLAGYTDPVVVTVVGATGVKYFDEGTGNDEDFGPGSTLRAVVPAPLAQVGVSALTNAAVANLEAAGGIASATPTTINDANTKIAAVFGLPDILVAPNPVSSTAKTLDLTLPADKYALVLAAFAKSGPVGTKAATLTTNFALDMKDGILDGKDGKDGKDGNTVISNTVDATDLATAYQDAAVKFATDGSKTLAASLPLVVKSNVTEVTAVANQSDVSLAKAMFAELRTTLSSFANGSKTGFLDTQATSMNADLTANVAPEMTKVGNRISALNSTMSAFEAAKAYASGNTKGFAPGHTPFDATANVLVRADDFTPVIYGYGSAAGCWTDSPTTVTSKITCAHAGSDAYVPATPTTSAKIKMVVYELTGTVANSYTYTATRYNWPVTVTYSQSGVQVSGNGAPVKAEIVGSTASNQIFIPAGAGTVSRTITDTTHTGLAMNGTLPPSATAADGKTFTTGVDTIAISAVRSALTAVNNYRYALSGSVATTNLAATAKVVTLSLDSGSYIDLSEPTSTAAGPQIMGAKFVGTAKTAATKFTGSLDVGSFATSKNNEFSPTSIVFNGSISDTSTGGAGEMLTGKLEATVADYANFDSSLAESSTNYLHASMTFTGTVQAPSRPLLKLVVAAVKTGVTTGDVTLNYSYGTNISISGSGKVDSMNPATNTLTLSNQDGIQFVIAANQATTKVTKSGADLASIGNGRINYSDNTYESLN